MKKERKKAPLINFHHLHYNSMLGLFLLVCHGKGFQVYTVGLFENELEVNVIAFQSSV